MINGGWNKRGIDDDLKTWFKSLEESLTRKFAHKRGEIILPEKRSGFLNIETFPRLLENLNCKQRKTIFLQSLETLHFDEFPKKLYSPSSCSFSSAVDQTALHFSNENNEKQASWEWRVRINWFEGEIIMRVLIPRGCYADDVTKHCADMINHVNAWPLLHTIINTNCKRKKNFARHTVK